MNLIFWPSWFCRQFARWPIWNAGCEHWKGYRCSLIEMPLAYRPNKYPDQKPSTNELRTGPWRGLPALIARPLSCREVGDLPQPLSARAAVFHVFDDDLGKLDH